MTDITLEQRARELAEKLRAIHDDPLYQAVWASAHNHGINYANGPKYDKELEALEAALRLSAGADCPKRLLGWRTGDYLYETTDRSQAINWLGNVEVLPIFEGDPNTKLAAAPRHETGEG